MLISQGKETLFPKLSPSSTPQKKLFRPPLSFFKENRRVVIIFCQNSTEQENPRWLDPFGSPHESASLKTTGNKLGRMA